MKAGHTFTNVKWLPAEPADGFSFFDMLVVYPDGLSVTGFIYFPHPDTKPEHFQQPDVLELLLPFMEGLHYDTALNLEIPKAQMVFESATIRSKKRVAEHWLSHSHSSKTP